MEITSRAKIVINQFEDEAISITAKWGKVRVSDEGLIFAELRKGSLTFAIPANEILDMCMAWMHEQQKERDQNVSSIV